MNRLEPVEYQRLFRLEAGRMATVSADELSTDVPHLEGWTVHNVVGHMGWVCRYVVECLRADPDLPPSRSSVGEPPVGAEVLDWFGEGAERAREAMGDVDLHALRPTFTGPKPGSWWLRRLSLEMAIHRWDALASVGTPEPIDAAQARDGIDEVFDVFAPNRLNFEALGAEGETIHLHSTDLDDGEWLVDLGPDSLEWHRGHAKGDVAARGSTSDLLLLMWSRIPASRLEVFGDADLLQRWQSAAAF